MNTHKKFNLVLLGLFFSFLVSAPQTRSAHPLKMCRFDRMYQLGDESTGNSMTNFLAKAAGIPNLTPYKSSDTDFEHGINFARAGSTALKSKELLDDHHVLSPITNNSLADQLDSMSTYFNSICINDIDCAEKLKNAFFIVGGIGTNDYNMAILQAKTYNRAIFQGMTMSEINRMIPRVVDKIMDGVRKAISIGAQKVVVPGMIPIGCLPMHKSTFENTDAIEFDRNHCLSELNDIAMLHNRKLQQALDELKHSEKPNAIIVYGDNYKAFESLIYTAKSEGIDTEKACCGAGGKYNFDFIRMCGTPNAKVCEKSSQYISWDGISLTDNSNKLMAGWFADDIFTKLQCS